MFVLRQNQDVIVTVVEVLLYDPRYEWTLTEKKAAQLQNQASFEIPNIDSCKSIINLIIIVLILINFICISYRTQQVS